MGRSSHLGSQYHLAEQLPHVALAWLLQKQPVVAPIIGATKLSHLETAIGSLSLKLTAEEIDYMEAPYVPHNIVGHN